MSTRITVNGFEIECDVEDVQLFKDSRVNMNKRGVVHIQMKDSVYTHRYLFSLYNEQFDIKDLSVLVDHKDGNRLNNKRNNLRQATRRQNNQNRGISKINTTGFNGLTQVETSPGYFSWVARIATKEGNYSYTCKSLKQAAEWRFNMEVQHFEEFQRNSGQTFEQYWGNRVDFVFEDGGEKMTECEKCHKSFKNFHKHVKTCTGSNRCVCGKDLRTPSLLMRHQEGNKKAKGEKGCAVFKQSISSSSSAQLSAEAH